MRHLDHSPLLSFRRPLRVFAILPLLLLLVGCQMEIYQGLTESQANIMLATLLKNGIDAQKSMAGKKGFTIAVDEKKIVQALEILKENSLPREEFKNMGTIFSGQGMIASPTEEEARKAYALSQELSDTFSRIDGVLTARVHVVLSASDQTADTRTPPSAGVFLRHTPESQVVNLVPKIRELSANAVPGLTIDRVTVMLVPLREAVGVPIQPSLTFMGINIGGSASSLLLWAGGGLIIAVLGIAGILATALKTNSVEPKDERV